MVNNYVNAIPRSLLRPQRGQYGNILVPNANIMPVISGVINNQLLLIKRRCKTHLYYIKDDT